MKISHGMAPIVALVIVMMVLFGCADAKEESQRSNEEAAITRTSQNAQGVKPRASRSTEASGLSLVTYQEHIEPLLKKHCIHCHGEDGSEPTLLTYEQVKESYAVDAVLGKRMPMGKALQPEEINFFFDWQKHGFLEKPEAGAVTETTQNTGSSTAQENKELSEAVVEKPAPKSVGYVQNIEPLLKRYNCTVCHAAGLTEPELTSYGLVKASATVDSILAGRMPKGGTMTKNDQDIFFLWRELGYPLEAQNDSVPAPETPTETKPAPGTTPNETIVVVPPAPTDGVSYDVHIVPLLTKYNCLICHAKGSLTPELTTYEMVRDSDAVESVLAGRMPVGAEVAQGDKDLFLRWKEGGYLESLGGQEPDVQCNNDAVPETGFRRLSSNEYKNSLMAVSRLALDGIDFTNHPADPVLGVFSNDRSKLMTTRDHKEYYMSVGEEVAALMVQSSSAIPDNCRTVNTDGCIDQLIPSVASDAYRRPVGADEITEIKGIYTTISDEFGHAKGLEAILEVILSSPNFIYRTELGEGGSQNGLVVLGPYEIASQLSYMLIGSPPDAALLADAKNGGINDAAVRISHAQRLMASEAFLDQGLSFMDQWLGLNKIEGMSKDMDMFPEFTSSLKAAYRTETSLFIRDMFANLGSPKSILTADYAFLNPMLKQHYGLPGGGTNEFVRTSLAGTSRSGLLTQGSFASIYAHQNETSPIFRGTKISTKLLCIKLPDPPSDIEPLSSAANSVLTTRERVAAHSSDPSCRGCHQIIDPLGFSLEGFDSIGKARTVDNNLPVDSSGTVKVGDEEITFDSYKSLASRIADNPEYNTCFTDQMMRFSLGSYSTQKNSCYINEVTTSWQSSGGSVKELLISIIGSDYFSMRKSN